MSETSRQKRSRIDLYYYRRTDAPTRWRWWLTLLALAIAGAWFAIAPTWGRGRHEGVRLFRQSALASKGPLAGPHAMWDANCEACHIPFQPIRLESSCRNCHAGPAHHPNQIDAEVPSCAECHRDHRGRDASLLAMDDASCTSCHRDLKNHRLKAADTSPTALSVTRFSADAAEHPAFTPPAGVPGPDAKRIKFNHARHLAPGLTTEPDGAPFTFAGLKAEDRARYGRADGRDGDPIQLRCDSCHRLDPGDAGSAGPRPAGDAMLPVSYENDCRACHPLHFDPKVSRQVIPHGLRPQQVVDHVKTFYAAQVLETNPILLQRPVRPSPMPAGPASEATVAAGKSASDRTLKALRLLFGSAVDERVMKDQKIPMGRRGCVECHDLTPASQPLVDLDAAATLDIKPVVVRSIWYEGARFNHATHRALECAACHGGAAASKNRDELLLPDAGKCVSCHAPATTGGGPPRGGADASCVGCHRYHNVDHPAQGIGAEARRAKAEMTVEQFLGGGSGGGR